MDGFLWDGEAVDVGRVISGSASDEAVLRKIGTADAVEVGKSDEIFNDSGCFLERGKRRCSEYIYFRVMSYKFWGRFTSVNCDRKML